MNADGENDEDDRLFNRLGAISAHLIHTMEEDRRVARGTHGDFGDLGRSGVSPSFLWLIAGMVSGALTGFFALVGAFVGALSGALAGRASDIGILRGAALGTIGGAVLAIEILEAYHGYLCSDQSSSHNTPMRGFLDELFRDRVLPERFSSARQMYLWQHRDLAHNRNDERGIAGRVASKGLPRALCRKLPSLVMPDYVREGHEECICCTICLQDIVGGETVRVLPLCFHTFHLSCVDKWLVAHSSCPVCRQRV